MKELIKTNQNESGTPIVSARDLHEFLEVGKDFSSWIKGRIKKYDFAEGIDYTLTKIGERVAGYNGGGSVYKTEYNITLNMAKELAMVQNNDKGKQIRKYFIAIEEKFKEMRNNLITNVDLYGLIHNQQKQLDFILDVIKKDKLKNDFYYLDYEVIPRKAVREFIQIICDKYGNIQSDIWSELYRELNLFIPYNLQTESSKKKISKLDYLELNDPDALLILMRLAYSKIFNNNIRIDRRKKHFYDELMCIKK